MPTSPGLTQPTKRSRWGLIDDDGIEIREDFVQRPEVQPSEMYGSTPVFMPGELGNTLYYRPHETLQGQSSYMQEARSYMPLEMDAITPVLELAGSPAFSGGRQPLSLDTSVIQPTARQTLKQSWSEESQNSTLCGSLPSGTTDKLRFTSPQGLTTASTHQTAHQHPRNLGHSQHPASIDPKLLTWISGSTLTASPEDADVSQTGLAPWGPQLFEYGPAATTDVVDHFENAEITSQTHKSAMPCDGTAHPGLNSAGSQGGGQMNWPPASPFICTPVRTVYPPQGHGAEHAREFENTGSNPTELELRTSHGPARPTGDRSGPLLAGTTVSTADAPAALHRTKRKATRPGKISPVSLEAAVSVEHTSPSMAVSLEADADKCPYPECPYLARGKKNRRTHLRRHIKTHENLKKLECPVLDCTSNFAAGRKDNLQHHLKKVHHLQDVPISTPATSVTHTVTFGSGDSSAESQTVQGATGETGDWEGEEDREPIGAALDRGQFEILNGIFFERDALLDGIQTSAGFTSATELEDKLGMKFERPADLPATAWNAEDAREWI